MATHLQTDSLETAHCTIESTTIAHQPDPDNETSEQFRDRLIYWLQRQMMFVSGETAEPSTETTGMIEEIVRAQVIEMVGTDQMCLSPSLRYLSEGIHPALLSTGFENLSWLVNGALTHT